MFKILKMIAMLKDVRAEVKAQGTLENIALSRKFWGMVWLIAGYVLREYLNVNLDQAFLDQGADLVIVLVTFGMQGFGIIMQLISYIKTLVIKIQEEVKNAKVQS